MKSNYKLINSIYLLLISLDNLRKRQFILVLIINSLNGLLEFISLGSALLFLEVLTNPQKISSSFEFLVDKFWITSEKHLVIFSTILFIILTIITTLIRIVNLWYSNRFRISFLNYISNKIYKKIITQDYNYHLNNNSSDLLTDITSNIDKTNFFFENLLNLITSLIISLSIIISLLKLNLNITIISVLVFILAYTLLGSNINKRVNNYSKIEISSYSQLIRLIQESLKGIKEIIISNNHNFYIRNFKNNNNKVRKYQGYSAFITTFPRYLFEGIGLLFIGITGFLIYTNTNETGNIIALLGTFALGAQKLLPSMQSSYRSWSLLFFYNKGLNRILDLLDLEDIIISQNKKKLSFKKEILLKKIGFNYSDEKKEILSFDSNLKIKKGEHIGIFGKTGSGKTTLINIIIGLLNPSRGNVFVDNLDLFNNPEKDTLQRWKNNISHVPQDIHLTDSTIMENIAFCVPKESIDIDRIFYSAKMAHAHEFITKTAKGYQTIIGENGIKLSGGQKQRLGLARAIYKDLDLLILDESTSALDLKTEKKVIESIFKANSNSTLTVITIAHRLSTLRFCDKVIEIDNGKIKKIYDNNQFIEIFKSYF